MSERHVTPVLNPDGSPQLSGLAEDIRRLGDELETERATCAFVKTELDNERAEVERLRGERDAVKTRLLEAFVPSAQREECSRFPLAQIVTHAIDHHQWHHESEQGIQSTLVRHELEIRDDKIQELQESQEGFIAERDAARAMGDQAEAASAAMRIELEDVRQAFRESRTTWQPQTLVTVFDKLLAASTAGATYTERLKAAEAVCQLLDDGSSVRRWLDGLPGPLTSALGAWCKARG